MEFRTHVDGSIGQDRLLRVRFGARVPGGLPVFQCATAVVGRPLGVADQDVAEHAFTLDNPACEWFGIGSTARVRAGDDEWAIGVAEVSIVPAAARPPVAGGPAVRDLVAALASVGVTATCTRADGPRYGSLDLDSNLPDVRIVLGGPEVNPGRPACSARWTRPTRPGSPGCCPGRAGPGLWCPPRARAWACSPPAPMSGTA